MTKTEQNQLVELLRCTAYLGFLAETPALGMWEAVARIYGIKRAYLGSTHRRNALWRRAIAARYFIHLLKPNMLNYEEECLEAAKLVEDGLLPAQLHGPCILPYQQAEHARKRCRW